MLTPDLIQKMNQATGKNVSLKPTVTSRADEIRALAKASTPVLTPEQQNQANTKEAFKGGLNTIKESYQSATRATDDPNRSFIDKAGAQLEGGMGIVSGLGEAAFSPVSGVIKTVTDSAKNNPINDNPNYQKIASSPVGAKIIDGLNKVFSPVEELAKTHPRLADDIHKTIGAFMTVLAGAELPGQVKNVATGSVDLVRNAKNTLKEVPGEIKGAVTEKVSNLKSPNVNDLQKINEKITPKPTIKQAKLATEEGRLYKGKEATTFKSSTPDSVATSDQQFKSTKTINKLIPKAAEMDEPTLHTAMKEKIGEISKKLKPEMQKVPIKPETIDKMNSDWKEVKAKQDADPYRPSDINLKAQQQDFETRLSDIKDGTMDDIWESAKAYDDSVPDRIKQADSTSSESLQTQHDMWLENRAIMRNAINDMENGLGGTSKSAFSDMRDLYEGQRGIMSKAKINTKVQPSTVEKVIKGSIKRVIPYSIGSHL